MLCRESSPHLACCTSTGSVGSTLQYSVCSAQSLPAGPAHLLQDPALVPLWYQLILIQKGHGPAIQRWVDDMLDYISVSCAHCLVHTCQFVHAGLSVDPYGRCSHSAHSPPTRPSSPSRTSSHQSSYWVRRWRSLSARPGWCRPCRHRQQVGTTTAQSSPSVCGCSRLCRCAPLWRSQLGLCLWDEQRCGLSLCL